MSNEYPKTKDRISKLFITVLVFFGISGFGLLGARTQIVSAQQPAPPPPPDNLCIGAALAEYMNGVVNGAGSRTKVKLFSPAFNITDTKNTPAIVQAMIDNNANFNGVNAFAANTYTLDGVPASDWFTQTQYGVGGHSYEYLFGTTYHKLTTFTEFGNAGDPRNIAEIKTQYGLLAARNGTVQSLLLFNALGTNPDPQWAQFNIGAGNAGDIFTSIQNRTKGGINSATWVDGSGGFAGKVGGVAGARWQLEIVNGPGDYEAVVGSAQAAISNGIIPIYRICVGNSCGFESDPANLADFIRRLDSDNRIQGDIWVIAGPNEPESELWATPGCIPRKEDYFPTDVACEEGSTTDPEFHSLRPYPASPCNKEITNTSILCGNDLVVRANYQIAVDATTPGCTQNGSTLTCELHKDTAISSTFNFNQSKLPIAGNTELVPNGFNDNNLLSSGQRTNDYVSWYLNGVTSRAEERSNTEANTVNYSGPLKKLLSWYSQESNRFVESFFAQETSNPETARHNQIAGCVANGKPVPCYQGGATPERHRLTEWLAGLVGNLATQTNPLPPVPEDQSITSFKDYWLKFQRWVGRACPDVPVLGAACSNLVQDNPWWTTLFSFMPTSSTEDRIGEVALSNAQPVQNEGFEMLGYQSTYKNGNKEPLYFAHMQENLNLARQLQFTFASKDLPQDANIPAINDIDTSATRPPFCEIVHSRTNSGDNLWARNTEQPDYKNPDSEGITANVNFTAKITCVVNQNADGTFPPCKVSAWVADYTVQTETPEIDNVWNRLVGGQASVFRMIYPKVGEGTPVTKIKDLPGSTIAQYSTTGTGADVNALVGNPDTHAGGPQVFFPHLGGISDYFLKGIQKALRPQGFTDNEVADQDTTTSSGGIVGSCQNAPAPYCDVNNLLPYFGNDVTKAENASQICMRESGGSPAAQNLSCTNQTGGDYSIGLFQINMLAHCPGAFSGYSITPPYFCTVKNQAVLDACVAKYLDPAENIKKMVELSKDGTLWTAWYNSAQRCGIIKAQ